MRFRNKVALVAIAVILQAACMLSMPRNLRKVPTKQYLKTMKQDRTCFSPKRQSLKTKGQSMPNLNSFPIVNSPDFRAKYPYQLSTNPVNAESFYLNETPKIEKLEDTKLINDLRKERKRKRKNNYQQKMNEAPQGPIKTNDPIYITQIGTFPETQYPLTVSETWGPNFWNPLSFNVQDPYYRTDDDIIKSYVQKNIKKDAKPTTSKNDMAIFKVDKKIGADKFGKLIDGRAMNRKDEDSKTIGNPDAESLVTKEETKSKPKITRKIKIITKSRPKPKSSNNNVQQLSNDSTCTDYTYNTTSTCSDITTDITITGMKNKTNVDLKFMNDLIHANNSSNVDLPSTDFEICFINSNNTNESTDESSVTCITDITQVTGKLVKELETIPSISVIEARNNDTAFKSLSDKNVDNIPVNNDKSKPEIVNDVVLIGENMTDSMEPMSDNITFYEENTRTDDVARTSNISYVSNNTVMKDNKNTELNGNAHTLLSELEDLNKFVQTDDITNIFEEETELLVNPDTILSNLERAISESKADGTIDSLMPKIKQAILEAIIESTAYVPTLIISNSLPTEVENNTLTDPNDEYEIIEDKIIRNQKYSLIDESDYLNDNVSKPEASAAKPTLKKEINAIASKSNSDSKSTNREFNIYEIIMEEVSNKPVLSSSENGSSHEDVTKVKDKKHLKEVTSTNTANKVTENVINTANTSDNESGLNNHNKDITTPTDEYFFENYSNSTDHKEVESLMDQISKYTDTKVILDKETLEVNDILPKIVDNNHERIFILNELNNDHNTTTSLSNNISKIDDSEINVVPLDSIATNENVYNNISSKDTFKNNHSSDINLSLENITPQLQDNDKDFSIKTNGNNSEPILTTNKIKQKNKENSNDIILNKNDIDVQNVSMTESLNEKINNESLSHRGETKQSEITYNNRTLSSLPPSTKLENGINPDDNLSDKENKQNDKEPFLVELYPVELYDDDIIFEDDAVKINSYDDFLDTSYTDTAQKPDTNQDLIINTPKSNNSGKQSHSEKQTNKDKAKYLFPEAIPSDNDLIGDQLIILQNKYKNQDNDEKDTQAINKQQKIKKPITKTQNDIIDDAAHALYNNQKHLTAEEIGDVEYLILQNDTILYNKSSNDGTLKDQMKEESTYNEEDIKKVTLPDSEQNNVNTSKILADKTLYIQENDTVKENNNDHFDGLTPITNNNDDSPEALHEVTNKDKIIESISSNGKKKDLEAFLDSYVNYSTETEDIIDRILKDLRISSM